MAANSSFLLLMDATGREGRDERPGGGRSWQRRPSHPTLHFRANSASLLGLTEPLRTCFNC